MDVILLTIRALLVCVLGVAGLAKLIDRRAAREAMTTFGVPKTLINSVAVLAPVLELLVAIALVPTTTAVLGASGSLGLFTLFTLLVSIAYARGTNGECQCFGGLQSTPIGPAIIARNILLTLLAGILFVGRDAASRLSFLMWIDAASPMPTLPRIAALLTLGMIGGVGFSAIQLFRQPKSKPAWTPPSPPPAIGAVAPSFELLDAKKRPISLIHLLNWGKSVLLIFVSPGCPPCEELIPDIERWQREHGARMTIAVICTGSRQEGLAKFKGKAIDYLLLSGGPVASDYGTESRPSAILIGPDGFVVTDFAIGAEEIAPLVERG